MVIGALSLSLSLVISNAQSAVPPRSLSDEQIIAQAQLVVSGPRVEIYQHRTTVDASFLKVMERVYDEVEPRQRLETGYCNAWLNRARLRVERNRRFTRLARLSASEGS